MIIDYNMKHYKVMLLLITFILTNYKIQYREIISNVRGEQSFIMPTFYILKEL